MNAEMSARRYLTFSLRTLFVLLTIGCVWLGILAEQARHQREAVEAIEALGGMVTYNWEQDPYGRPDPTSLEEPRGPVWLRQLIGDEYFQEVEMVRFPVVPGAPVPKPLKAISYFQRLRGLKTVVLWPSLSNYKAVQSEMQQSLPHCEIRVLQRRVVRKVPFAD